MKDITRQDLTFVAIEDLIDELLDRFEHGVIVGKMSEDCQGKSTFWRWTGDPDTASGLANRIISRINGYVDENIEIEGEKDD